MNVYPDLAYYLSSYRYRNEFLNTYFENYKYQKITNRILPSFDKVVEEQAIKMDFVTILKPRTAYVDQLDTQNAQVFFVDAMGVEYFRGTVSSRERCRTDRPNYGCYSKAGHHAE